MNINNLFAGLFAFILGFAFVWVFWDKILLWITQMTGDNTELAILLAGAAVLFGLLFLIVYPLNIAKQDETKG